MFSNVVNTVVDHRNSFLWGMIILTQGKLFVRSVTALL